MYNPKSCLFSIFFITGLALVFPSFSYAQCSNPSGGTGAIEYTSSGGINFFNFCDGANWVPWAGMPISGHPAPQFSDSGGFAAALNDLTDVNEPSPNDGECLKWVDGSSEWQGGSCGSGGGGSSLWDQTGSDIYYNSGNVGIGDSTPDVALDVVGDINFTGSAIDVSDIRLKENVRPLQSPLKKLTALTGFAFEMKGDPKHATEYGVSAQDVQTVFPELVHEVDTDGTLGVAYNGLIAPMIEAMKEQQAQIEALRAELEALKAQRRNEAGEQ